MKTVSNIQNSKFYFNKDLVNFVARWDCFCYYGAYDSPQYWPTNEKTETCKYKEYDDQIKLLMLSTIMWMLLLVTCLN